METQTKIIIGVSIAVLVGIISFVIYWFTRTGSSSSSESSQSSSSSTENTGTITSKDVTDQTTTIEETSIDWNNIERLDVPGEMTEYITSDDNPFEILEIGWNYLLIKKRNDKNATYQRCNNGFSGYQTVTGTDGKKSKTLFRVYCPPLEHPICVEGQTDVFRFDCDNQATVTDGENDFTIKCKEEPVKTMTKEECKNVLVSCLAGKCTTCCDRTAGATGFCPQGSTLIFNGKCYDPELPVCDPTGCTYICNGTKSRIATSSVKFINKKCINDQCILCGIKNETPPSCVYGTETQSGTNTKNIVGGCDSTACSVVADWKKNQKTPEKQCKRDMNYSCTNGNCVACC
jgi:hypothetical protein